jgi:hypothetical protein
MPWTLKKCFLAEALRSNKIKRLAWEWEREVWAKMKRNVNKILRVICWRLCQIGQEGARSVGE